MKNRIVAPILTVFMHIFVQSGIAGLMWWYSLYMHQLSDMPAVTCIFIQIASFVVILALVFLDYILCSVISAKLKKLKWYWHICGLSFPVVSWILLFVMFLFEHSNISFHFACISVFGINLSIIERMLLMSGCDFNSIKLYSIKTFFKKSLKYIGIILLHYIFTLIAVYSSVGLMTIFPKLYRPLYQFLPMINGSTSLSLALFAFLIGTLLCFIIGSAGWELLLFYFCRKRIYCRWYLHLIDLWVPIWLSVFAIIGALSNGVLSNPEFFVVVPIMVSVIIGRIILINIVESRKHPKTDVMN